MAYVADPENRRRSLEQAGAGAASFAAGTGASYLLSERLKAKGQAGPYRAAYRSLRGRTGGLSAHHVPHLAGKLGARGLQGVGLPLAAYGVVNAVRAKPKATKKLDVRHDIVAPAVHTATLQDQVDAGRRAMAKALTPDEQRRLSAHRRIGRATALTGGTLGLAALATRAPGGAKLLARKVPGRALARVAAHEPHATQVSNTLGVGAIGTGSAGSFNYAAQQKLERKKEPVLKRDRTASGAALAGAGAATAGIGLVGGGIPGVRAKHEMLADIHQPGLRGAGAAAASARGGVFGFRTDAHRAATVHFARDQAYYAGKPANRAQMFSRGHNAGKVAPEHQIIRHLRGARRASYAALAGGTALTAYGIRRARTPVQKDRRDLAGYSGTLAGAGLATAAASEGGRRVLMGQSKAWRARQHQAQGRAAALVPNTTGHTSEQVAATPHLLAGKSKAQAYAAGEHRGYAAQARYFANTYRKNARMVGRLRNPALAVGAAGLAGVAASKVKVGKHITNAVDVVLEDLFEEEEVDKRDDAFLRGYRERISPEAERGYRTLKTGRNEQAAQAVGAGSMAALGGWLTHHELRHRSGKAPAAIAAAGTIGSAITAASQARGAGRYHAKMGKIKAKARSRRAQGLYGPGRGLSPVDTSSANARRHA